MRMPPFIMEAKHVHPSVNTREDYLAWHQAQVNGLNRAYPHMPPRTIRVVEHRPPVGVSGGKAVIRCAGDGCNNFPSVALEWGGLACCVDCGAVYDGLEAPARWDEISAALVKRPGRSDRHFDPEEDDTVESLLAWNEAHGLGDKVEA